MIVLFLALVSTQVTKSSNDLLTNIAGSVTGVGPTRICPCSIVRTAYSLAREWVDEGDVRLILSLPFWAWWLLPLISSLRHWRLLICFRYQMVWRLGLYVSWGLCTAGEKVPRTPISYSLLSISDSFWARKGSWAGNNDNLCTSDLMDPQSLLYLPSALE